MSDDKPEKPETEGGSGKGQVGEGNPNKAKDIGYRPKKEMRGRLRGRKYRR